MSQDSTPRVSIGLPLYNGERFLTEVLESLLAQSFSDFELVISDNASTDGSQDICRSYAAQDQRIRYFRAETNQGAAWNFNNTVWKARGEYFKWAADDDLHHPQFVEKCVQVLDRMPAVVLCFARTNFIDENGADLGEYEYPIDVSQASRRQLFLVFAGAGHIVHEIFGVIRADVLRKTPLIGSYIGSDIILLGRLALHGRFYQIPECLFLHREHPGRSAIANKGAGGYTRWFDSAKSGKLVMPHWRRLLESARSVARHPMGMSEKAGCFLDIARAANWNRRALGEDILRVVGATRPSR